MEIETWRDKELILEKKLVVQFRGEIAQRRIYLKMSLKRGGFERGPKLSQFAKWSER